MRLWHDADFLKLWAGQTISLLGTQVTGIALALTAALPAGLWVDRIAIAGRLGMPQLYVVSLGSPTWRCCDELMESSGSRKSRQGSACTRCCL